MSQSNNEMSSFLAELAGEASQKLEAKQAQKQDRQAMAQSVNAALERAFQFFNLFTKHLNALEPDIPRKYALDAKTCFSPLKWKRGMVDYRKQSLADDALFDYVSFQVRLTALAPVVVTRRWELFDDLRNDLRLFGLKPMQDLHDLWASRTQKVTFQLGIEPEFLIRMRFQANYTDGNIELDCNNLDGFGEMKIKLKPELLKPVLLDEIGRFLMGRTNSMPQELKLFSEYSGNQ